jgi:hypothetical protein
MERTQKTMLKLLRDLSEFPHIGNACRANGLNPATYFRWVALEEQLTVNDFPNDGDCMSFAAASKLARKMHALILDATLREEATLGFEKPIIFNGEFIYKKDLRFVGWDDQEMLALGFRLDDRLLRDKKGLPIVATYREPAPAAVRIRAAAAVLPNIWGEHRSVDLTQRISGGVTVLSGTPIDVDSQPAQLSLPAPDEEPIAIEHEPVEDDFADIPSGPDDMAIEPAASSVETAPVEVAASPVEVVAPVEQAHVEVAPAGPDPLATARAARDKIMARLGKTAAPQNHVPMATQPAPRASFRDDIDPIEGKIEGIGAGGPGGFRVS